MRGKPLVELGAIAAVGGCLLFFVVAWLAHPWVMGDTPFVLDGSNAFLSCLHQHAYHACGYTGKLNYWGLMSPVGDWPLLQHIPDLIAIGLGASSHVVRTRVLETLNVLGVVASIVVARVVFVRMRQRPLFWLFVLLILSGPILWYARTTSGEVFAMGLLVCFVGAALLQAHPVLIAAAAFAASVTKETSYPFVAALGILALAVARERSGRPIRPQMIGGAVGVVAALVAASLFNIVRFGSVLNKNYLDAQLHTPGIGRKLENTAAVVLAPSGGILEFWPAATLVLGLACALPLLRARRAHLPAIVLIAVLLVLSVGFASWWTPFGWFGYGPRLMLPWPLPLALIALVAYADEISPFLRRLVRPGWRLAAVFVVVFAFTLPTIGQLWRPDAISGFFEQQQPTCPLPWHPGGARWYPCQHRQLWFDRPMSLYALHGVRTAAGLATAAAVAFGLAGCLILVRREPSP